MKQYLNLSLDLINNGKWITNERTQKRCLTNINYDLEYDCSDGFLPLVTTRKSFYKAAFMEMTGYLQGLSNSEDFRNLGSPTWDANANKTVAWLNNPNRKGENDMGRAYRFRSYGNYQESIIVKEEKPEITKDHVIDGFYDAKKHKYNKEIINIILLEWEKMIKECYSNSSRGISYKGDDFVTLRWLSFDNFLNDFKKIDNWFLKIAFPNEYFLNKDFYHSNIYNEKTARFSSLKEIKMNNKEFSKNEDCPLSYVDIDQVQTVYAKLKLGIDDRRLIMTAWHPHAEKFSCLPACMHTHTFSLVDGVLNLTSYQRSIDVPLGLVFNMPQTVYLLTLMAQITDHKPGKVFHKLINCHIYEDQLELMRDVQLKREPYNLPKFKINPRIKNFNDIMTITKDDFELFDYKHHDPIKYPFSE